MNVGIFIGRFQPFHNGHKYVVDLMLQECDKVIILVGSSNTSISLKNPFNVNQRADMIAQSYPDIDSKRLVILPLRDSRYNYNEWLCNVQNTVNSIITTDQNSTFIKVECILYGMFKDDSSFYLKDFPQWQFRSVNNILLNATDIREELYLDPTSQHYNDQVPPAVASYIRNFWLQSDSFQKLVGEMKYINEYKESWKSAPYPPTFVTTDCVVIQSGHILLIERGRNPGKGKLALPGGFLEQNETIYQSALRELSEETKLPKYKLDGSLVDQKVFDHPSRDPRGRTITHAFFFKLQDSKSLPNVSCGDDASKAFWITLSEIELCEQMFFLDHYHIINYFIKKI